MCRLYGLFGEKLSHSLSPKIHKYLFEEMGIDGSYHLFELNKEDIKDGLKGLKVLGCNGINVTVPYKLDVIQYLDSISKEAQSIGAVNTIEFKDGMIKGYNTDYYGFGLMIDKLNMGSLHNKSAVVLGTGGASKSIVAYLKDQGINELIMVTRSSNKAIALEEETGIPHITYEELKEIKGYDIIINTTPCGMYPNIEDSPIGEEIKGFKYALDIIYNPCETRFLRSAKDKGLATINGLYMLIGQAVKAQEIWNNTIINVSVIDRIYDELIIEFEV